MAERFKTAVLKTIPMIIKEREEIREWLGDQVVKRLTDAGWERIPEKAGKTKDDKGLVLSKLDKQGGWSPFEKGFDGIVVKGNECYAFEVKSLPDNEYPLAFGAIFDLWLLRYLWAKGYKVGESLSVYPYFVTAKQYYPDSFCIRSYSRGREDFFKLNMMDIIKSFGVGVLLLDSESKPEVVHEAEGGHLGEVLDSKLLVKMETYFDGEYWCAKGIGEDIFTQGKTFDELITNIKEAVSVHFEERLQEADVLEVVVSGAEVRIAAKAAPG